MEQVARQGDAMDEAVFARLLRVVELKNELQALEDAGVVEQLAQTSHVVLQLVRLNRVLDSAMRISATDLTTGTTESPMGVSVRWEAELAMERSQRVELYKRYLDNAMGSEPHSNSLIEELRDESRQLLSLTLLKAALDKNDSHGEDTSVDKLTAGEVEVITSVYDFAAATTRTVGMTIPPWFVASHDIGQENRWGVAVTPAPVHARSEAAVVETAQIWWELHHPHVVKFVGACHLGETPFVVHERTRPLTEHIRRSNSKAIARKCMLEVALGVRYLHEMGLTNANLTPDKLVCADFRAKAMIGGWDLVSLRRLSVSSILSVTDREAFSVDKRWWAPERSPITPPSLASDVFSLGLCFIELLRVVSSTIDGDEAANAASLTIRPSFIDDAEWNIIKQMCTDDPAQRISIRSVVEHMKDLVEADAMNVMSPGVSGLDVLETLSQTLPTIENRCHTIVERQLYLRLVDVKDMLDAGNLVLSSLSLGSKFCELVLKFKSALDQLSSSSSVAKVSATRHMTDNLISFHMELDRFLSLAHIREDQRNQVHRWKPQFDTNTAIAKHFVDSVDEDDYEAQTLQQFESRKSVHQQTMSMDIGVPRWFIPVYEVTRRQFIDRGSFGAVYHGTWFDTNVVVKEVILQEQQNIREVEQQFRQEADIWFQLNHVNIVQMYGACHVGRMFFVAEYAARGTLESYLCSEGGDMYLAWLNLLYAAKGLRYLHDLGIVHGDLKGNNILVGEDGVAKLTDFGLSDFRKNKHVNKDKGSIGAYRWKAPECLAGEPATFESDIYSFGMCIIEIVSGEFPWGMSLPDAAVKFHVKRGKLPPRPSGFDDDEWVIVQQMCCFNPQERIDVASVVVQLTCVMEKRERNRLQVRQLGALQSNMNRVVGDVTGMNTLVELVRSGLATNPSIAKLSLRHLSIICSNRPEESRYRDMAIAMDLFERGDATQKKWFAVALGYLTNRNGNVAMLSEFNRVIPVLIDAIRNNQDTFAEDASRALGYLARDSTVATVAAKGGAIPALNAMIRFGNGSQKEVAAETIGCLANTSDESKLISEQEGSIALLVNLIAYGTYRQMQAAKSSLDRIAFGCDSALKITTVEAQRQWRRFSGSMDRQSMLEQLAFNTVRVTGSNLHTETSIAALVGLCIDQSGVDKAEAVYGLRALAGLGNTAFKATGSSNDVIIPLTKLLSSGTDIQKSEAAEVIGRLASEDDGENRAAINAAGAIPLLVSIVQDESSCQKDRAMWALGRLATRNDAVRAAVCDAGAIPVLVSLVARGTDQLRVEAMQTLGRIASGNKTYRDTIIAAGAIPALVLASDQSDEKARAAKAIWQISGGSRVSRAIISDARAISRLISRLRYGSDRDKTEAAKAVGRFAFRNNANCSIIANKGAIPLLASLVATGSTDQKIRATQTLGRLAECDDAMCGEVYDAGVTPALVDLLRNGSQEHKAAVSSLLGYLADGNDQRCSGITSEGAIPLLLKYLGEGLAVASTLWTLGNLAESDATARDAILSSSHLLTVIDRVRIGNAMEKQNGVWLLGALVGDYPAPARATDVIEAVVPLLVRMLVNGGVVVRRVNVAFALARALASADSRFEDAEKAVADALPLLMECVAEPRPRQSRRKATWVLGFLARRSESLRTEIAGSIGVVEILREMAVRGNDRERAHAASTLSATCGGEV